MRYILYLLILGMISLLACGDSDVPETEQPAATDSSVADVASGDARYTELKITVKDIIAILQKGDDHGLYNKYVQPEILAQIEVDYGSLDSALTNFHVFRGPLRYALEQGLETDPEFNEDSTEAIYRIEGSPGPVNFVYMDNRWFFNP